MSGRCSAAHCPHNRHSCPGLSFFRFPKQKERCIQWIRSCHREDLLEKSIKRLYFGNQLCAVHFEDSQFANPVLRNRLVWNAVPTLFDSDPWQTGKERVKPELEMSAKTILSTMKKKKNGITLKKDEDPSWEPVSSTALLRAVARCGREPENCNILKKTALAEHRKLKELGDKFLKLEKVDSLLEKTKEAKRLIRSAGRYLDYTTLAFISSQLDKLVTEQMDDTWSKVDALAALAVHSQCPELYRVFTKLLNFPPVQTLHEKLGSSAHSRLGSPSRKEL